MLKWRLLSAACLISGLLGLLHLDFHHPLGVPGVWLLPLALLVTAMMTYELLDLWQAREDRPVAWPVYFGALSIVLLTAVPLVWPLTGRVYPADCPIGQLGWPLLGFVLAVPLVFVGEMRRYTSPGRSTAGIGLSLLVIAYAGLLMSFLVQLRLFRDSATGMVALISVIVIVKVSDASAYFTGRAIGRHKMAPVLSPGKTVEGAVGALLGGCVASLACFAWLFSALVPGSSARGPWWGWIVYALIVTVAGMIGDLAESLLKRDAARKDSSHWLPGLGGVLDVLDSLLFAAAPAYICWAIGLIGA